MPSLKNQRGPESWWRSLDELADTPEFRAFLESEFPAASDPGGISRRRWLQVMGASLALAGATGCWKQQNILPFARRPMDRVPGRFERYATAMDLGPSAIGLVVTTVDGRPIKIEGNPRHPQSLGATDALAQAAILQLYDPDRSDCLYQQAGGRELVQTWEKFAAVAQSLFDDLRRSRGEGFCVLAEASSSATLAGMRSRLLADFPQARWFEYEPISDDNRRAGARSAFGRPVRTHLALDQARVILSLDADLLFSHPAAVRHARDFAESREVIDGQMSRLYVVESCFSVTGAAADHRLPLPSTQIAALAAAVEREVLRLSQAPLSTAPEHDSSGPVARLVRAVAHDLTAHRGRCIVAAGLRQPAGVHAAAHRLNVVLGNVGKTVTYTREPWPERPSHVEAIRSLAAAMRAGGVRSLVILGGNPVYNAPADVKFAEALENVGTSIHLSLYRDETSRRCTWHLPGAHFLESWGDARAWDGTYSVVQPMIAPLHGGRSSIELLAMILGHERPKAEELVRQTFEHVAGAAGGKAAWRRTLHDGLLAGSRWPAEDAAATTLSATGSSATALSASRDDGGGSGQSAALDSADPSSADVPKNGRLEIIFCRDGSVYDGRFANNGWLQELPDPLSKLTWDNAALVSPATAEALGVENETLVVLKYGGRSLEIPALVVPGTAPGCVAVQLGYGRTAAGHVGGLAGAGVDAVGVDVYPLRTSRAMDFDAGLTVEPTGRKYPLATTQDHYAIDAVGLAARTGRVVTLIREATLAEYKEHPKFARHAVHHEPLESLWREPDFTEPDFKGHRWGMSIDLSRCIGCGACVVACQAENNIPVVGKGQVLRGREMHWIRVDRYFRGEVDDPRVAHQPVPCQQCEMAPCEQVCPVAATVHSAEGLNEMVYNRCVGTRYCANNCPYKVRRFNFFNFHKDLAGPHHEITKMMYNPEVTVRSRGVMEKCTYCVQRIQAAKIDAHNRGQRTIPDGRIQTACRQACPSGAIVFGDLADSTSDVARAHKADRAYAILAELNDKPRTRYLARIRNPNPVLEPVAESSPLPQAGEGLGVRVRRKRGVADSPSP